MKNISLLIFLIFISCGKSVEDNCFENDDAKVETYKEEVPFTVKEILSHKPDYLTISTLKNFRSFKDDSLSDNTYYFGDEKEQLRRYQNYKKTYVKFDSLFNGQFGYYAKQSFDGKEYALAKNKLGFWLTKIENSKAISYF